MKQLLNVMLIFLACAAVLLVILYGAARKPHWHTEPAADGKWQSCVTKGTLSGSETECFAPVTFDEAEWYTRTRGGTHGRGNESAVGLVPPVRFEVTNRCYDGKMYINCPPAESEDTGYHLEDARRDGTCEEWNGKAWVKCAPFLPLSEYNPAPGKCMVWTGEKWDRNGDCAINKWPWPRK